MDVRHPLTVLLERFAVDQPGAIWVGILLIAVVAADFERLRSWRNLALGLLMLPALPMVNSLTYVQRVEQSGFNDPGAQSRLELAFALLFCATALMAVWSFAMSRGRGVLDWRPNLATPALRGVALLALALSAFAVLGPAPDDAGRYTNLGAQRWRETGTMPYGDPGLKGPNSPAHGAGATYGPLLYLAHLPFQLATGAVSNPPELSPMHPAYVFPPALATKLACLSFHLVGLWALFGIGRRLGGEDLGLALVTLYAGSTYMLGVGSDIPTPWRGDPEMAGGLVFISHVAPNAMLLVALRFFDRPAVSGAAVAAGAGALFWPAFLFPAFFGWQFWRDRRAALRFAAGFAAFGAAIALLVIVCTDPLEGKGPVGLIFESTLEHQEGFADDQYGRSPFSFWGNFPDAAAFWQRPIVGTSSVFKPTFMLFVSYCIGAFALARGRSFQEFALLVASLAAALQLWKTHAAGTYVEWYYPFLLIGLLGRGVLMRAERPPADAEGSRQRAEPGEGQSQPA